MSHPKVPAHMTDGLAKSDFSNVNAAAGRTALEIPLPLAVNKGGTGATTSDGGRAALGAVGVDCGDILGSFVWAAPLNSVPAGNTFKNYGETVAGSLLVPAGQTGNTQPRSSTTLTGTYRCLGYAHNNAGAAGYPATLYQKISMT